EIVRLIVQFTKLWAELRTIKRRGTILQILRVWSAQLETYGQNQKDVSAILIVMRSKSKYPKVEGPDVQ
ncbi:unnamed protein product, partial [Brassica oleracea]